MGASSLKDEKVMKKKERGTYDHQFDEENKILAITWKDNNDVKVMSNHEGIDPLQKVIHFKRQLARVYLALPFISDHKKAGRPSLSKPASKRTLETIRKNPVGHFIVRTTNGRQRKCGICNRNARKQCSECDVDLHMDCFQAWHK
ncbi:hypothetical protein J6590_073600 [Homalodisca vitripennis]|nr:hypothetical protein J6590_073600 [Homalodisca vitripennis]